MFPDLGSRSSDPQPLMSRSLTRRSTAALLILRPTAPRPPRRSSADSPQARTLILKEGHSC